MDAPRYQQLPERVVWREGTLLQAQHMQQLERHLEGEIQHRFQAQHPYSWGLLALDFDRSALQRGIFELKYLAAIMPDASALVLQEGHNRPPARSFSEHFSGDSMNLYIALPQALDDIAHYDKTPGSQLNQSNSRYRVRVQELGDATAPNQRSSIETGQSRAKLLFSNEDRDGYCCLSIARVIRGVQGYETCPDFIAPALDIRSSPTLMSDLSCLLSAARAQYQKLLSCRSYRSETQLAYCTNEMERYFWLAALGPAIARLDLLSRTPCCAPHRLYEALHALSAALNPLCPAQCEAPLSPYLHDALFESFDPLFSQLHGRLSQDFDSATPSVRLELQRDGIWLAPLEDPEAFQDAKILLTIEGAPSEAEWSQRILRLLKLSAPSSISTLIQRAVSGCSLRAHLDAPTTLPLRRQHLCLEVSTEDLHWQEVIREGAVAVYGASQLNRESLGLQLFALPKR